MGIVQELEHGIEINRDRSTLLTMNSSKEAALREFYTIGFRGPRQLGKTNWMIRYVDEHPNSLVVLPNDFLVEEFIYKLTTGDLGPFSLDEYTPHDAEHYEPLMVITTTKLKNMIADKTILPARPKRVIVDNAAIAFNTIRINKYYEWLALQEEEAIMSVLID
jgi:hypothetical protein